MTKLIGLLVGMHFHPPAGAIIEVLPAGCQLEIIPEPDNPYDPLAMRVLVSPYQIPESQRDELELKLGGFGMTWEDLESNPQELGTARWMLGHIASAIGKPFAKAQARGSSINAGCIEFERMQVRSARLEFDSSGAPLVVYESSNEAIDDAGSWEEIESAGENTF